MFTDNQDDPAYKGHIVNAKAKSKNPWDRVEVSGIETRVVRGNKLDNIEHKRIFDRLLSFFRHEIQVQAHNRAEMARDEDFYDNEQWTEQERNILLNRGQQPLVFNVIATTINWMLGTQRRARTDHKILPRRKEGSRDAENKTKVLKYLDDVNRAQFHLSRAFKDQIVAGVGWMEAGVQSEDAGEPIYNRYESWRNILNDSLATEVDNSDARYLFRTKWVDGDMAASLFPDRKHTLERAVAENISMFRSLDHESDEYMDEQEALYDMASISEIADRFKRDRLRLIECWFKLPTYSQFLTGGQFGGELFDVNSTGHMREVESGRSKVVGKVRMRMHYAILCEAGLLFLAPSPYRHNTYPFTPMYCYRRGKDNQPYGMVRNMRDPQSDLNKRASKALHILSTRRTIMDEGAVADMRRYQEEVSRPDAMIVKKQGKDLRVETDTDIAAGHLDLMSRSVEMIQQIGGVTDENLGRKTNATSGKAITARQDQGALATAFIFDNLRLARQIHGEKKISLVEQYMREEREFRITNSRGSPEYITVNRMEPGEGEDPEAFEPSDLAAFKADFIVAEDEFSATIRQAQFEELMELTTMLAPTAPEIALSILDLVIEVSDMPNVDEIVARIRKISGQKDPDQDEDQPPTPEEQEEKAGEDAQKELANRMAMLEVADKEATVAEKQAKAAKAGSEAERVMAEVRRILAETQGEEVDVRIKAIEAATKLFQTPALGAPADAILQDTQQPGGQPQQDRQGAPPQQPQPQPLPQEQPQPQPQGEGQPPIPQPNEETIP